MLLAACMHIGNSRHTTTVIPSLESNNITLIIDEINEEIKKQVS